VGRLALLFVVLDRLKNVNETQGHVAGVEVLLLAAGRLERAVRAGDAVARFGGDEFVVICENVAGRDEAAQIAARVRESLAAGYQLSSGAADVPASIGVALDSGERTVDELLRQADRAAYRAKELGRNRVEVAGRMARTR
jgi:diguanylate cyclase (GGDEF)-like protein